VDDPPLLSIRAALSRLWKWKMSICRNLGRNHACQHQGGPLGMLGFSFFGRYIVLNLVDILPQDVYRSNYAHCFIFPRYLPSAMNERVRNRDLDLGLHLLPLLSSCLYSTYTQIASFFRLRWTSIENPEATKFNKHSTNLSNTEMETWLQQHGFASVRLSWRPPVFVGRGGFSAWLNCW